MGCVASLLDPGLVASCLVDVQLVVVSPVSLLLRHLGLEFTEWQKDLERLAWHCVWVSEDPDTSEVERKYIQGSSVNISDKDDG